MASMGVCRFYPQCFMLAHPLIVAQHIVPQAIAIVSHLTLVVGRWCAVHHGLRVLSVTNVAIQLLFVQFLYEHRFTVRRLLTLIYT